MDLNNEGRQDHYMHLEWRVDVCELYLILLTYCYEIAAQLWTVMMWLSGTSSQIRDLRKSESNAQGSLSTIQLDDFGVMFSWMMFYLRYNDPVELKSPMEALQASSYTNNDAVACA